jgi:hypothetical protein
MGTRVRVSKPYMILTGSMFTNPVCGVQSLCAKPGIAPALMPKSSVTIRALLRLAICAIALAVPSAAFADCGHEIIDQAYKGKITKHYSQACYNTAIRIEPVDGSSYSDIDSIIRDAKRADALRARDASVVSTPSGSSDAPRTQLGNYHGPTAGSLTPVKVPVTSTLADTASVGGGRTHAKPAALSGTRATTTTTTTTAETTELGAPSATPVLDRLAPAHAGDLPVAVIVLGVLASLLVLAGVAGAVLRRRSARSNS